MEFGENNQGLLTLDLNDVTFDTPGVAVISADLTYSRAVPEPSTFFLIAIGAFRFGFCRVRVKSSLQSERE